jgi:hypothetical protein
MWRVTDSNEPMTRLSVPFRRLALGALLANAVALPAAAQSDSAAARLGGSYYGPRLGVTWLAQSVRDKAEENGIDVGPAILQFGWQWEQRFVISADAPMLASAFVLTAGGAEQGVLIPSLSWLLGIRGTKGGELALGPVVSLTGVNLGFAAGITKRYGEVYVPWNVVVVTGEPGLRVSLFTGFNMNRRRMQ